ncbi:MAG TPA: hypothetical protein DEQ09_05790 [Bacteroidales bacterium]|nr:hypothetical protein [Bacteroidales bacterium]
MGTTKIKKAKRFYQRRVIIDRIMLIVALVTIIISAIIGLRGESRERVKYLPGLLPDSCIYEELENNIYRCYMPVTFTTIAYVSSQEGKGFSGPLKVAVLVDTTGKLIDLDIILNRETPSYFNKVTRSGFILAFKGMRYADLAVEDNSPDVITGATYTCSGIKEAVTRAVSVVASSQLGESVYEETKPSVKFGIPEISLIILYLMVLFALKRKEGLKKVLRWIILLAGLVILGLWFSIPLSLGKINMLLLGYWPDWHTNLYWYMLIFSVFGITLVNDKRWYCNWICPFLAVQEGLAFIGGGKVRISLKARYWFRLLQRVLVWVAIVMAFLYRTPSKFNYELFGAFFNLTATIILFFLLAIFLIASLFIKRPYCNILCPINALNDLITEIRKGVLYLADKIRS